MKSRRTLVALAGGALALVLGGCAADPYYNGYYGSRYAYDEPYGNTYYEPGYYYGPSVSLGFGFSSSHYYDGRHHWWRDRDGHWERH